LPLIKSSYCESDFHYIKNRYALGSAKNDLMHKGKGTKSLMAGVLIDGKKMAENIRAEIKIKSEKLHEKGIVPGLAVILVGDNPASKIYVASKEKVAKEVGFYSKIYTLPENTKQEELIELIKKLSDDDKINGILVQLPLPKQIDRKMVLNAIPPQKDVDGFHPVNVGALVMGEKTAVEPCTPKGCMYMLESLPIDISGKKAVVIGRSNIVGKPAATMLMHRNATVTVCHSHTENLKDEVKNADIVIAAVGKPRFITGDMIKENAVVIDVGINRMPDGKITGDVDFESAKEKASYITPVPGGVGPMTIAMLMSNTLEAAMRQNGISE